MPRKKKKSTGNGKPGKVSAENDPQKGLKIILDALKRSGFKDTDKEVKEIKKLMK